MNAERNKKTKLRRKRRIGNKIFGTEERPRLCVFRSNKHIYAQVVDDMAGVTLAAASTRSAAVRDGLEHGGNIKAASVVGEAIAKEATNVGIKCVRFDRNGYRYHGRVKALADAARKSGLVF